MKIVMYILAALPVLYIGMLIGFYLIQDYLIFRGTRLHVQYEYNFPWEFEERFYVNPEAVILNALLFKAKDPKGLVFYNHGNTGHIQSWGERAGILLEQRYDVFMYDYRGYGKSSGSISNEKQLHRDAAFLYKEILNDYPADRIVIYGISLGTGISSKLAARFEPKALILETPYYHFFDVIRFHYPFLPVKLISKYKFRTNYFIRRVKSPIYAIHGTRDETISYKSSLRLKQRSPHIHLILIEGGEHSNLPDFEAYRNTIVNALS